LSVSAKGPETAAFASVMTEFEIFVTDMLCAALLVPIVWLSKVTLLGETKNEGGVGSCKSHIPRPCVPARKMRVCASSAKPVT
jgi:hypothetical protein